MDIPLTVTLCQSMDRWMYRPVFTRALAGFMTLLLATAFKQWLDMAGLVQDPGVSRRLGLAFLFWCEAIVLIPPPPAGLHIVTISVALVMFTSAAAVCIETTAIYVIKGILSDDLPYTTLFALIATPIFLISTTIAEFTGKVRTRSGWFSWLVQDARFIFIGTACSILGLILTVWPWTDIVHSLGGGSSP